MKRTVLLLFLSFQFYTCNKKTEHEVLFQSLFLDISEFSIKKHERDWNKIEAKVRDSIKTFESINDFYSGVEYTLNLIDDKHSFFIRAGNNHYLIDTLKTLKDTVKLPKIESKIVSKNTGYIKINGFATLNTDMAELYALKIRKELIKLDHSSDLSGWIIDLKNNFGGNSFIQPLALSPLFKDSILGYHINNKGNLKTITCENNLYKDKEEAKGVSMDFENELKNKEKKIAVLINNKTASNGEFIAMILKSQENSRLFGEETSGATSTLKMVSFSNGAFLYIAEEYWCDKNHKIIKGGIKPDVECTNKESLKLAIDWIEN